ncbi:hypothetical protein WJX74_006479 [Apatococcus lobatus]|uniref:2-methoxy-6-polyprenyl-1,4-benzoquinol methylase, mitochondrial n=1 Tax=Apatococcus lobatus TaxID=904363 RepID=A0AAW1QHV3_9CHLO
MFAVRHCKRLPASFSSVAWLHGTQCFASDAAFGAQPLPPPPSDSTASFGYEEVPEHEKSQRVGAVFNNVSSSYDQMNDAMSLGLHRLWKDRLVTKLSPFPGMQHLDVAGGTGDVAFRIASSLQAFSFGSSSSCDTGSVTVCDINESMLQQGQARASKGLPGGQLLRWVVGDAENLPFPDASFDSYTIAFGIRNVTRIQQALDDAVRVLKPGGRFMCLEFSHVDMPLLKEVYDLYSFNIIPKLGKAIANDEASYQYLVESIRRFPPREEFSAMLEIAQLQRIECEILTGGVVAMYSGFKL